MLGFNTLVTSGAWTAFQPQARLSILIYHRVLAEPDPLRPDDPGIKAFEQQVRLVSDHCRVLPLAEAIERLYAGNLPRGAVAITFDDGYADNYTNALPILQGFGAHATFFIATGFLNGGWMFNDRVIEALRYTTQQTAELPELGLDRIPIENLSERREAARAIIRAIKHRAPMERQTLLDLILDRLGNPDCGHAPMMSDQQVRGLHEAGMGVGAHTVTHPILQTLNEEEVRWELTESRAYLERLLGAPVPLFAYPNGKPGNDYTSRETRLLREAGFLAAVCTAPGGADRSRDRFQLPRYTPHGRGSARFLIQLMRCSREEAAAA